MLTPSNLRILAICSVLVGGIVIASYPRSTESSAIPNRLSDEKIGNNTTQPISSVPSRNYIPQNSAVSIAINQNGNIRRADPRGYINVGIRETYKIEINSPSYTSAVSVKIDGVSIIDGLICDRSVILERPRAIAKQFIVLEEGNPGLDRDGGINNPDLGLIEVTFKPIKRRDAIALDQLPRTQEFPPSASAPSNSAPSKDEASKSRASENRSNAVGTGLSGTSSQDFVATNEWVEAPEIAPTYTKKYRLIGLRAPDPVTLHNMNQNRPSEIADPAPPRL
ncbi:MAG: hypothetical protein ACK6CP_20215 [Pseudanabaena sp.]|jgi:hypothetical protein|nr:hypothetical protein [Pseudanabaena sp. M090S1SP2A07QC]MCA6505918.1 hypothetical protein [Pseudanabaena sp. M172S2SP2A07QC]MCA6519070.1 hypothetical protein [Pseudanabaena sp. M110S1SP2A07QC]MCA6521314.1 hypothetical protein [Pseudanabaena sp. M051S1SP2A07QC]MCA6525089.1 hypothetical protein [Pseudanabaena sp. M179S2SP2A07QC]MCA6529583.1 hypothetical protein [Pseudanabaena sp. M125S2SP2A07QC]MCA6534088.1 hypothetical protein [Pseudanabaena sp. M176S2SP2A07QC]MCA6537930.1 hypothetical prot